MGGSTSGNFFGTGNSGCGNVDNSYNKILNIYPGAPPSDREREILEWLSSLESQGGQQDKRHQDVRHNRVDGIGD